LNHPYLMAMSYRPQGNAQRRSSLTLTISRVHDYETPIVEYAISLH
jgi:hypothetical protein